MSAKEHYKTKIPVLTAIALEDIKHPHHVPVGIYIQEAQGLYAWVQEDKGTLVTNGFNWEWVEDLPVRIGALAGAEAQWQKRKDSRQEDMDTWVKASKGAYELRDKLYQVSKFAARNHPNLLRRLKGIAKSQTNAGMIQDLQNISVFGNESPEIFEAIGFDVEEFETASITCSKVAKLYAAAESAKKDTTRVREMRDRAYTHLKEAVDEIRAYGRFVFRGNKERLVGYRSNHIRKTKARRSTKPPAVPEEQQKEEKVVSS